MTELEKPVTISQAKLNQMLAKIQRLERAQDSQELAETKRKLAAARRDNQELSGKVTSLKAALNQVIGERQRAETEAGKMVIQRVAVVRKAAVALEVCRVVFGPWMVNRITDGSFTLENAMTLPVPAGWAQVLPQIQDPDDVPPPISLADRAALKAAGVDAAPVKPVVFTRIPDGGEPA